MKKNDMSIIWAILLFVTSGLLLYLISIGTFSGWIPPGSATLPAEKPSCVYYDFKTEFHKYFGDQVMTTLKTACINGQGIWNEQRNDVSCRLPSSANLNCNDSRLDDFEKLCKSMKGSYYCYPYYVGCLCQDNPPPALPEEESQEETYTCGWHDTVATHECGGTCPSGQVCTQDGTFCNCVDEGSYQYGKVGTIFITSKSWSGAMGGISGGNNKCQQSAVDAGLSGTWIVMLSDDSTPLLGRVPEIAGGYYLLNGNQIATNKADMFDGTIMTAINVNENNVKESAPLNVWTGTMADGLDNGPNDCHAWGWVSAHGTSGNNGYTNGNWIYNTGYTECSALQRLYCMRIS